MGKEWGLTEPWGQRGWEEVVMVQGPLEVEGQALGRQRGVQVGCALAALVGHSMWAMLSWSSVSL